MAEHHVPDLHEVAEKIHQAHDAEDQLMRTMPSAIHPNDNEFPGMTPPPARAAQPAHDEAGQTAEQQPAPEEQSPGEEAFVESTVVEDDSPPPADPDHP